MIATINEVTVSNDEFIQILNACTASFPFVLRVTPHVRWQQPFFTDYVNVHEIDSALEFINLNMPGTYSYREGNTIWATIVKE